MPRIAHDQKQFYKAQIRSLISIEHGISRRELQERLDKDGSHLDRDYIGKLYDEIIVERGKRMDRQFLNNALSSFEDTMTEIVKVAWSIAQKEWLNPQVRVMALRESAKPIAQYLKNSSTQECSTGAERNIPDERKARIYFLWRTLAIRRPWFRRWNAQWFLSHPCATDKRSRLQVVAPYIKNRTVLFPRTGWEQLLGQIFNLGVESHDDCAMG